MTQETVEKQQLAKLSAILNWAEHQSNFDTKFVEELQAKMEKYRSLTEGQERAVDNIISKFRIDVDKWAD